MKKLLAILVLGLLLSSNAYTASVDDCDGIKSNSTTVKYECVNGDTMTVAAGTLIKKNWVVVTPQKYNAQEVTINNSGTIKNNGTQDANAFLGNGSGTIKINNLTTDSTIQGQIGGMNIGTGDDWTIDNYGKIYGVTQKAITVKSGDNLKVTNQSGGLIRAGVLNSTTDTEINAILIWGTSSDSSEDSIIENYGTITAARNTIKAGSYSGTTTITNYSGGVISNTDDDGEKAAIRIDGNNVTLTNKGTISGTNTSHSIEIGGDSAPTGTKIYIDGAPTFTGEIELTNSTNAGNTTVYLGCSMTQDTTIEIHNHGGALNVENNLCGNDTYTLSTEDLDDAESDSNDDSLEDDGYLIIDEGLEVVSNNASYRSENVLTKLKGLFSAANYIDGVEPEDKFFRVFYSNVKRENMYEGSMAGVVGQLSPIKWGNVTSNVFLGYSKHHGDFDNGEFLGGGNFALGLKNVFTKNGMKVSFSPMIGLNDLDVTDYDSDSTAKVKTNLLSEFLAINGKIDKKIKTSEIGSLNLSVQSTLGLQRFPDYLSKFSDGDLSVDEAIEQVLSGGFEVKYNEELGKGFIIRPYVGVSVNHNVNNNIDIVKDDDSKPASPADTVTSGYYAGLTLNKKTKDISFDLDLMYGNEDGLINQIAAVSFTKSFGKAKTQTTKLEKKPDFPKVDESLTSQDYNKDLNELETLKNLNKKINAENAALKTQNKKLKLLAQKALEENEVSKRLIVELLKENEKIKLEKQMYKNKILESENKELLEQLEGSNEGNKPPIKFLVIFATIFVLVVSGLTSLSASIYNRTILRPARV